METPKDIQKAIKLPEQQLKVLPDAPVLQRIDEGTTLLAKTGAPSLCVIDFFAARDWPQAGESSRKFSIHREADNLAVYRLPAVGQIDRLEESLYWLLSGATIVYFVLGIIGG